MIPKLRWFPSGNQLFWWVWLWWKSKWSNWPAALLHLHEVLCDLFLVRYPGGTLVVPWSKNGWELHTSRFPNMGIPQIIQTWVFFNGKTHGLKYPYFKNPPLHKMPEQSGDVESVGGPRWWNPLQDQLRRCQLPIHCRLVAGPLRAPGQLTANISCRSGFVAENRVKSHGCWDMWHILILFFWLFKCDFGVARYPPFLDQPSKFQSWEKCACQQY